MTTQFSTLYLVRHGQTNWNSEHKVMGHEDIELNEIGIQQAHELKKILHSVIFDKVFSSDLLRCKQTAEIIAMNKQIAIETTKVLREQYYGRLQGQSLSNPDPQLNILWEKIS